MEFATPKLKKLLIFQERICKALKPNKNYSLELLTYYCIHYYLAILFSAKELLITHSTINIEQNFGYVLRVKGKGNICTSGNEITLQIIFRTF